MYKKGSAFLLIYGLYFLVFLGVLFIIFNQIQKNEITNVMESSGLNITDEDKAEMAKFGGLWNFMPYIIIFLVAVFFFVHIGYNGGL
jgi:hypothetical protein